jgi:hypothetical protein
MHVHLGSVQSNRRSADTGSGLTVVTGETSKGNDHGRMTRR